MTTTRQLKVITSIFIGKVAGTDDLLINAGLVLAHVQTSTFVPVKLKPNRDFGCPKMDREDDVGVYRYHCTKRWLLPKERARDYQDLANEENYCVQSSKEELEILHPAACQAKKKAIFWTMQIECSRRMSEVRTSMSN